VNIVLFEPSEIGPALATSDNRYRHIKKVLRRDVGDSFDVGKINGPRGKALITKSDREGLHLQIKWERPHQPGIAPRLAIGFPRPQTARDILREATSIGVSELSFVSTARSDPNYDHQPPLAQRRVAAPGDHRSRPSFRYLYSSGEVG